VESRRSHATARAKVGDILQGHLFIPFHYGYWDDPDCMRAANELTVTEWDPVSKQPYFKHAAVRARKVSGSPTVEKISQIAASAMGQMRAAATELMEAPGKIAEAIATAGDERPLNVFLGMTVQSERRLADAFRQVGHKHMAEPDIHATCLLMASWSQEQAERLKPFTAAYHKDKSENPDGSVKNLFDGPRSGGMGLLRDLHDLWLATNEVHLGYEAVKQAAKALRDQSLAETCERSLQCTDRQIAWLRTRIDQAAPQTLVVS
jgi:hypothetical protein